MESQPQNPEFGNNPENFHPWLPWLARTIVMVPTCHFMHNQPWIAGVELVLDRTILHSPKPGRAIEVLLYCFNIFVVDFCLPCSKGNL